MRAETDRKDCTMDIRIPLMDLKQQYRALQQDLQRELFRVLERTNFILGDEVQKFEEEFAAFCEARYCVGLNSGTDAIQLSLHGLGIGPGDEVITTPYTYIATLFAILRTGATVKLADIEPETATIDPAQIKRCITEKTKAIVPVHVYGHPANMQEIGEIAAKHRLAIVEDACQAHGARANGKRVGGIGSAGTFSFYPSKNLGAYGDAGAVVTNDKELYEKLLILRNQGDRSKYDHVLHGLNSRLDALQAAVLRVKLPHLDAWNKRRQKLAAIYNEELHGVVRFPRAAPWAMPVYHLYTIFTDRRKQLQDALRENGIGTGIYYHKLCHLQPAFDGLNHLGYTAEDFPIGQKFCAENLALPLFPEMRDEDVTEVAAAVRAVFKAS